MDPEELNRLIQTAMQGQASAGGAAQQTAAALAALTRSTAGQTTATNLASQAAQNYATSQGAASSAAKALGSTAESTARNMIGLMTSVYGADKAFTGFIPALTTYSTILQDTIRLVSGRLEGVGIQIGTFGINFGRMLSGAGEVAARTIGLMSAAMQNALEASQKVADAFTGLTKYGALFGTSIVNLQKETVGLGIPIQQFSKMVQANIENITKFGVGTQKGGVLLGSFANELFRYDAALVAQYGNFENLAQVTGDYLALQTQLGIDVKKNSTAQLEGAREYLLRQKELSNITGKTAERMKQEEETRRQELAYASKLSRLGDDAKNNVQEGMELAGKIFGERGAKFAQEYFATGGKVISKESLEFAALMPDAANSIEQFMSTVNQGRQDYRKGNAAYLENNRDALAAQAALGESLAELTYATANPQLRAMSDVNSKILANLTTVEGYTALMKQIEQDRAKLPPLRQPGKGEGVGMVRDMTDAFDAATQSFVIGNRKLQEVNIKMDALVVGEVMPKMAAVVTYLGDLALAQIKLINTGIEELQKMGKISDDMVTKLNDWLEKFVAQVPEVARPLLEPGQNLPTRATGGVTSGPTIAGENGTEAVIPLAGGSIPMNIDWAPLTRILQENLDVNREILDAMEDSVNVQEQILKVNY